MYKLDEKFLSESLSNFSRTLVGRLCKQNELLASKKDLSEIQKLSLIKDFAKELIYEETRNLESQLKAYSEGREYSKIYNPSTSKT